MSTQQKVGALLCLMVTLPSIVLAQVTEEWVAHFYTQAGDFEEYATSIAVDNSGNVYVTGSSGPRFRTSRHYVTIKYNASGVEQWVAEYKDHSYIDYVPSMAVDNSGNVYITGKSLDDYVTIKYNTSGVQQWTALYDGPGSLGDYASSIAVDDWGNVYVTGRSDGPPRSYYNYATIKYNTSGVQQWVASYKGNGPQSDWDEASSMAVDNSGNVYVTGFSRAFYKGFDYATIKYNTSGVQQWVARYNGPGNFDDYASSIAVDNSGNVYVTGRSWGSDSHFDLATIKYDASGDQEWVALYNDLREEWDYTSSVSMAVDNSGNVYVTGSYGSGFNTEYITIKYNANGVQQWVALYSQTEDLNYATSIAVDDWGNVYVTGISWPDYATIKYNTSGVQQWVARYKGYPSTSPSIAVDNSGNVYVTGGCIGYVTIKYVQVLDVDSEWDIELPQEFGLAQNHPNPFNPETVIEYQLPEASYVILTIYNLLGQQVHTLVDEGKGPGYYTVTWDGRDNRGVELASGVYFYQLKSGDFVQTKKMLLLK